MKKQLITGSSVLAIASSIIILNACSKSSPGPAPTPDLCAGKTIVISPVVTDALPCGGDGKIKVSATGSSGFSFKLNNNGTYQTDDSFSDLAAGAYTLFAKDKDGCEKSIAVTVAAAGPSGPFFTAVKALIVSKCQPSCHNNTTQNGGMNWEKECNIVTNSARIKVRAVDEGTMPQSGPLSQADKDIITNWITAGGKYGN